MNQFGIGQGNPEEHFRDLKDEAASLVELEAIGAASGHAGARYGSGCFSCVEISKNCNYHQKHKNQHHRDHVDQAARFPAWRLQRSSQRRDGLYLRHGACNYQNVHSLRICVNVCVGVCVCVCFSSLISLQTRHFLLEL